MYGKKKSIVLIFAVIAVIALCATVAGCTDREEKIISSSDIAYLDEIQDSGNLKFEWLTSYSASRPTAVIFHGESDGQDFNLTLNDGYVTKAELEEAKKEDGTVDTEKYTVAAGIGYKAQGLNKDLAQYWTKVAEWNVAIFHWEDFAVEENPDDIVAKFYSLPKMRYYKGDGAYETSRVPHNTLTEVVSALYNEEMTGKANGREIRFIGNGVGANLMTSVAAYLSVCADKGMTDSIILPSRLAVCDPYFSVSDMKMPSDNIGFIDISTKEGTINVFDKLLEKTVSYGAVAEIIETQEVTTKDGKETVSYAYDVEKSEKAEESYKNIKTNSAHLILRESYSTKFTAEYKSLKRIALDWYLYSIIGSDDSGNAGSDYAMGYPRNVSDFQTYFSYSGFNWAPNETRPMVNNRALNNDGSSSTVAGSRGQNFALSAWTPTVYLRALRGISFTQQKKVGSSSTGSDIHGNSTYALKDYTMEHFRSENFQVSDQKDYTLVCGYVYMDKNKDGYINDGFCGIKNARLKVKVTTTVNSVTNNVAEFEVNADENGFYVIRFNDKTKDSEGALSKSGYAFTIDHKVNITLIPESHDYYGITSAVPGVFYETVNGHNFSSYAADVTVSRYYADGIKIANCLVRPNETK